MSLRNNVTFIFFLSFTLSLATSKFVLSQESKYEWFPKNCIFPMLEYDLLEVQPYAGIFFLNSSNFENKAAYIPVNLGFRKSFLSWNMFSTKFDLALGAASYTQFEILRFDQNTLRGGLLNTDFKASGFLNVSKNRQKLRIQVFHISSHLGDDYILRNRNYDYNDKTVNYEQIDITYLYNFKHSDIYFGIGYVITPNTFRKRFMSQLGFQGNLIITPQLNLAFGSDVKLIEENQYKPDIHTGFGVTFNQREMHQLNISLDTYFGNLPYSTLDFGTVFWIGPSCRIYL